MVTPRPSLRDIARRLNVSHVTVSMALRNHPRISSERRAEVQEMARKLGYQPDPMLASLIAYRNRKRVKPIVAALAWINRWPDPKALRRMKEFEAYWEGASEAASRLGYRLEEFQVSSGLTAARFNRILVARGVQGVLVPPHPAEVDWGSFNIEWTKFAVVRFGFSASQLKVHMIGNDQMRSSELAVRRMVELGYSRIGYVSDLAFDGTTDGNFRVGYQRGLETIPSVRTLAPLLLRRPLVIDPEAAVAPLKAWLARWKPDAILSSVPQLRVLLERLGRRVPQDIGLAATTVRDSGPVNAGIDQNPTEIGRVAVQTLIELVNRQERGMPEYCRRVLVESRWVDGDSLPARGA
jgi:LacI family transcriptional regulator